jgi:hypothetical protein
MRFLQFLVLYMAYTATSGADDLPVYRPLPDSAVKQMERQRTFVVNLVSTHFPGERITGTEKDFALLQRVLDAKLLQKTQTWELQSLGIVFGDALTKRIPGLHWMEVTDSYGTDPALLYLDTTLQLNPLSMISKRVEDGKPIDVADLVLALVAYVEKEATQVDKRRK